MNGYAYDELEPGEEDALHRVVVEYAAAMGIKTVPDQRPARSWVLDTAHALFAGRVTPEALDDPDATVVRGDTGIALLDAVRGGCYGKQVA